MIDLILYVKIRDIYLAQLAPLIWEFGHVRETPDDWEQRFEKIDAGEHTHRGKVFKPNKTLCFYTFCISLSLSFSLSTSLSQI